MLREQLVFYEVGELSDWKKNLVAASGEFVGTFLFLWIALAGTSFANIPDVSSSGNFNVANASNILYIALVFGFSLAINVWMFFRVSGGLFNPAITLGLMIMGAVPLVRGVILIVSQFVAAIVASYLVLYMFPTPLRAETTLNVGTSIVQGVFIEAFLTAELVMAIFMLAVEKSRATFIAPIGIGLAFFVAELTGVYYTGGSLNPARSLGPAVANGNFPDYHWIYYVGPLIGTLIACLFYKFLLVLEYRTTLPDQDKDAPTLPAKPVVSRGFGSVGGNGYDMKEVDRSSISVGYI
eukprot:gene6308-6956_t